MEKITQILSFFFLLNDICIDKGKSELIVINNKKKEVINYHHLLD
jgi:hypothetical protein